MKISKTACPISMAPWVICKQRGYRRFILIGHSLGAIKSIIYQGTRQRADVVGIVSCSAPQAILL